MDPAAAQHRAALFGVMLQFACCITMSKRAWFGRETDRLVRLASRGVCCDAPAMRHRSRLGRGHIFETEPAETAFALIGEKSRLRSPTPVGGFERNRLISSPSPASLNCGHYRLVFYEGAGGPLKLFGLDSRPRGLVEPTSEYLS